MSDTLTMQEAADELGWTKGEFFDQLLADGMMLEHPGGGYVVSPHPDIIPLNGRDKIIQEGLFFSALKTKGQVSLCSWLYMSDNDPGIQQVLAHAKHMELIEDVVETQNMPLYRAARIRTWRTTDQKGSTI